MASFFAIAQGFKITAGLAQVAFALWVVIRSPRTRTNVAFALAFGANGIAYAICFAFAERTVLRLAKIS